MRALLTFPLLASLLQCGPDETLSGYGAGDTTWRLTELDGAAFPAQATITFPEEGRIAGEAPCNTYFATQSEPYPGFNVTQVAATRRACPDLALETAYFKALEAMTLAEVTETTLILSTPEGREMVFRPAP